MISSHVGGYRFYCFATTQYTTTFCNSIWTEWSTIQGVIGRVISNSDALKPGELVVIRARLSGDQNGLGTLLSTQVLFINLLMYLNSREKGGVEAEREERERWITREQQKIMDSVNGKLIVRLHFVFCGASFFLCVDRFYMYPRIGY